MTEPDDAMTRANLRAAIETWSADMIPGGIVTGYVMTIAVMDPVDMDERSHYLTFLPPTQPMHIALGLTEILHGHLLDDEGDE